MYNINKKLANKNKKPRRAKPHVKVIYIVPVIILELFRTTTHSYGVSFSIKKCFYETNKFFLS